MLLRHRKSSHPYTHCTCHWCSECTIRLDLTFIKLPFPFGKHLLHLVHSPLLTLFLTASLLTVPVIGALSIRVRLDITSHSVVLLSSVRLSCGH